MPSGLFRRRAAWTEGTVRWLAETGARLLVSCGAEFAEEAGLPAVPPHQGGAGPDGLPPCVDLGDLTADEARGTRARLGIPEGALTDADAAHPLALRMLAEVRSDLAGAAPEGPVDRDGVLTAHLDLTCLRIARRLAGGTGARGTAVRRLAARAAGKAHEAARHCLGTEDGALDRETFERLFPAAVFAAGSGTGPRRKGEPTGWVGAVSAAGSGTGPGGYGERAGWAGAASAAGSGTGLVLRGERAGRADARYAAGPGTGPDRNGEPVGGTEAVLAPGSGTGPGGYGERAGWAAAGHAAVSGTGLDRCGERGGWADWADAVSAAGSGSGPYQHGETAGRTDAVLAPGSGTGPGRHGETAGWAHAVLAEGLLVPAGDGYRFAHQELADWLQGGHLDLDGALHTLVHAPDAETGPVPRHRIGPVVQALLSLARRQGTARLASRLADLTHALDADPGSWWAARLLTGTLARVPDAGPYTDVLRLLADRVVAWREQRRTVPDELGPAFWTGLRLPVETRCALLRRLVPADRPRARAAPASWTPPPRCSPPTPRPYCRTWSAGSTTNGRCPPPRTPPWRPPRRRCCTPTAAPPRTR